MLPAPRAVGVGADGGREAGGELLFWGTAWKGPLQHCRSKSTVANFHWALSCSQKANQLLTLPWFHQNQELPALTLHWGELMPNEVPGIYASTWNQIVSKSNFLWFCPVLPIPKFSPSSKMMASSSSPAVPQQAGDVTGHGLPSVGTTELTCLAHQCGAFSYTYPNFCEEKWPLRCLSPFSPLRKHSHVVRRGLGPGGWVVGCYMPHFLRKWG